MSLYSLRKTLFGDEFIVTVARIDLGSVWMDNGRWNVTRYGMVDTRLPKTFNVQSEAIDYLIRTPERP